MHEKLVTTPVRYSNLNLRLYAPTLNVQIMNPEIKSQSIQIYVQALTNHIARLQLRLKEAKAAPPDKRSEMLHELEEFAQKSIPETLLTDPKELFIQGMKCSTDQKDVLRKLREHLRDLEHYISMHPANVQNEIKNGNFMESQIDSSLNTNNQLTKSCFVSTGTIDETKIHTKNVSQGLMERMNQTLLLAKTTSELTTQILFSTISPTLSNKCSKLDREAERHYGNLRAETELNIESLIDCFSETQLMKDEVVGFKKFVEFRCSRFCKSLMELLEHGLIKTNGSMLNKIATRLSCSVCPWSCQRSTFPLKCQTKMIVHDLWSLIVVYYELERYRFEDRSEKSVIKLPTRSRLIQCIENCLMYKYFSPNPVQIFEHFVRQSLNDQMLSRYLFLITHCQSIVTRNYETWSYVRSTACVDLLSSLDRLSALDFTLEIYEKQKLTDSIFVHK
ncbi:hypothetical protein ACOME3_004440 [Neoechinorhynchus agilis]